MFIFMFEIEAEKKYFYQENVEQNNEKPPFCEEPSSKYQTQKINFITQT